MKRLYLVIIPLVFFALSLGAMADNWHSLYDSTVHYAKKEKFKIALKWGEQALELAKKNYKEDDKRYTAIVKQMVDVYYYAGKYDASFECAKLDSSLRAKSGQKNTVGYAQSLNNLGALYLDIKGDFGTAEIILIESKEKYEDLKDPNADSLYSVTLNTLAILYELTSKYSKAVPLYQKSLNIWKRLGGNKSKDYAYTLNNLSNVYKMMARYEEAEPLLIEVISIDSANAQLKSSVYAIHLHNLAGLYVMMGQYEKAEPLYQKSLEVKEANYGKQHKAYSATLNNLAELYRKMGRFKEAEPIYQQSLEIKAKVYGETHPSYATTLNNYALLNLKLKNFDLAESLYQQAIKIYEKKVTKNHPSFAKGICNLGKLNTMEGNYTIADSLYNMALDIQGGLKQMGPTHPDYAQTLYFLGGLYEFMGQYQESEGFYKKALKIRGLKLGQEHPDYILNMIDLAALYQIIHRHRDAAPIFTEALSQTMDQVKKKFPYLSEKEKQKFWKTLKRNFEIFNSFAVSYCQEDPTVLCRMMNNLISTKGLILSSTKKVFRQIRASNDTELKELFDKWQSTKDYWIRLVQDRETAQKLGIDLDSLAKYANSLEKQLSQKSDIFRKAFDTNQVNWKNIQQALAPDEASLEIVRFRKYGRVKNPNNTDVAMSGFTDTVYYAVLIITKETTSHPELVLLENGADLEGKYARLYGNLVKIMKMPPHYIGQLVNQEIIPDDLKILYENYWQPIAKKLNGPKKLYISIDGIYNNISLQTLVNPESKKYLLEEYDIRIVTNTSDILTYKKDRKENKSFTAELFGDPRYFITDEQDPINYIAPLPGTKVEVEDIAQNMEASNWTINKYMGKGAIESGIKQVNSPYLLHIATHGYFMKDVESGGSDMGMDSESLQDNPLMRSMLFFAGAENTIRTKNKWKSTDGEDGLLYAEEAMNLNLDDTELVVLSACETGLGEVQNGEGVYGLQRAFQVAGAKTLIMSLWTVSDESTKELMINFYTKLLAGMNKREAFREAQIELKEKYADFYYWGAFVMVGE